MVDEQFLTPAQVAERLQVQERTVTRWLRQSYLRGYKLNKEWRIAASDLLAFIERHANGTRPPQASPPTTHEPSSPRE